jgi:hypothetical protein
VHGSATAPSRKQATTAITHSGRLPTSVITDVAAPDAAGGERAGRPRGGLRDLGHRPLAALAVPADAHHRAATRRGRRRRRRARSSWAGA